MYIYIASLMCRLACFSLCIYIVYTRYVELVYFYTSIHRDILIHTGEQLYSCTARNTLIDTSESSIDVHQDMLQLRHKFCQQLDTHTYFVNSQTHIHILSTVRHTNLCCQQSDTHTYSFSSRTHIHILSHTHFISTVRHTYIFC